MAQKDSYVDYSSDEGSFTICKVKGKVPDDKPACERNRDELESSGGNFCYYYRSDTEHCDWCSTRNKRN